MQKNARISLTFFFAILFGTPASAELRGELENPFRFFRYPSDYAVQRIAFDLQLKTSGSTDRGKVEITAIELALQDSDFWTRSLNTADKASLHWPKSWKGDTPLQIIEGLRKAEGRRPIRQLVSLTGLSAPQIIGRFGWATLLDTHLGPSSAAVCWNRTDLLHNNCKNYVKPTSWRVRVFDDADASGSCKWQLDDGARFSGNTRETTGSCDEIYLNLTAATNGTELRAPTGRTKVIRTNAQGDQTALDIVLHDRLIVGLGDSYSSGEGNPDRPVVLTSTVVASSAFLPRRPSDDSIWAAQWIDRSCHRSAYSWQFRSAIHQTLIDPLNPVTFLSLACSGAEVVEGLLFPWRGPEPTRPTSAYRSQLAAIYKELCAASTDIEVGKIPNQETDGFLNRVTDFPWAESEDRLVKRAIASLKCGKGKNSSFVRPIDAILLGVAGNDVGFARWIAGAITEDEIQAEAGGFIPRLDDCEQDQQACKLTKARLARLKSRLAVLRRVLVERVIKDGSMSSSKLLMVAYPKAVNGIDGLPCPNGNEGMTLSVWNGLFGGAFAIRDNSELKTIDRFRDRQLVHLMRNFARPAADSFEFIEDFVEPFAKHGFCATALPGEAKGHLFDTSDLFHVDVLEGNKILETLHMPRIGASRRVRGRIVEPDAWRPFAPGDWRPYASRSRWVRTPNDVFMTVNNKPSVVEEGSAFGILDLASRGSSGAFHPTAEGHIAIAKAVVPALAEALK